MSSSVHSSKANQLLAVYSSGPQEFNFIDFSVYKEPKSSIEKMASNSRILALEITDRGAWWAIVHMAAKSQS